MTINCTYSFATLVSEFFLFYLSTHRIPPDRRVLELLPPPAPPPLLPAVPVSVSIVAAGAAAAAAVNAAAASKRQYSNIFYYVLFLKYGTCGTWIPAAKIVLFVRVSPSSPAVAPSAGPPVLVARPFWKVDFPNKIQIKLDISISNTC